MPQQLIKIHDGNWPQYCDYREQGGTLCATLPRKTPIGGIVCAPARKKLIIPKAEWKDRVRAMAGRFARQRYEREKPRTITQNGLPYCWAWSFTQTVEAWRAIMGLPYVELAPESLGGSVNWARSGNYIEATILHAAKVGICARDFVRLHDINPRNFKPGWQENALLHLPTEWDDLGATDIWAETVSALLEGEPVYVAFNWWRHAVMLDELVLDGDEICPSGPNSWGPGQRFILQGSRKVPSSAVVPRVVTYSAA